MDDPALGIYQDDDARRDAYQSHFMQTPSGRDVLHDLMMRNYFFQTMTGDGSNNWMAYANGRRDAILDILSMTLQHEPVPPGELRDMWDRALEVANARRPSDQ